MIDLHNHILPDVDDGAADLEESLNIARQFVSEGVSRIAATPHLDPERGRGIGASEVRTRVSDLQSALDDAGIDLSVVAGNELYLTPDSLHLLQNDIACTLGNGKGVLIEVSMAARVPPIFLDDTAFQIQSAGYQVVLAHPERYPFVLRDPESLLALLDSGVVLQLTAPALLGEYGPKIQRTSMHLLRRGMYSLAASDRHHPGSSRSLAELHDRISRSAESETADMLLIENPERVLSGGDLMHPEPLAPRQTSLLLRMLGRA